MPPKAPKPKPEAERRISRDHLPRAPGKPLYAMTELDPDFIVGARKAFKVAQRDAEARRVPLSVTNLDAAKIALIASAIAPNYTPFERTKRLLLRIATAEPDSEALDRELALALVFNLQRRDQSSPRNLGLLRMAIELRDAMLDESDAGAIDKGTKQGPPAISSLKSLLAAADRIVALAMADFHAGVMPPAEVRKRAPDLTTEARLVAMRLRSLLGSWRHAKGDFRHGVVPALDTSVWARAIWEALPKLKTADLVTKDRLARTILRLQGQRAGEIKRLFASLAVTRSRARAARGLTPNDC